MWRKVKKYPDLGITKSTTSSVAGELNQMITDEDFNSLAEEIRRQQQEHDQQQQLQLISESSPVGGGGHAGGGGSSPEFEQMSTEKALIIQTLREIERIVCFAETFQHRLVPISAKFGSEESVAKLRRDFDAAIHKGVLSESDQMLAAIQQPKLIGERTESSIAGKPLIYATQMLGSMRKIGQHTKDDFDVAKKLIATCSIIGKSVICATQMLGSMGKTGQHTEDDFDVAKNAVLDGADCVILSEDLANSAYTVDALITMHDICLKAETAFFHPRYFEELLQNEYTPVSIAFAAPSLALQCRASVLTTRIR
ncbi:hypothetical protein niasHT_037127 [Heterodera trifolii]|uniref:pyruvate kinase n=1 Tax=Heterodera trifolii TaxID=157864 RepID=A0ABD2IP07_9BILA